MPYFWINGGDVSRKGSYKITNASTLGRPPDTPTRPSPKRTRPRETTAFKESADQSPSPTTFRSTATLGPATLPCSSPQGPRRSVIEESPVPNAFRKDRGRRIFNYSHKMSKFGLYATPPPLCPA